MTHLRIASFELFCSCASMRVSMSHIHINVSLVHMTWDFPSIINYEVPKQLSYTTVKFLFPRRWVCFTVCDGHHSTCVKLLTLFYFLFYGLSNKTILMLLIYTLVGGWQPESSSLCMFNHFMTEHLYILPAQTNFQPSVLTL